MCQNAGSFGASNFAGLVTFRNFRIRDTKRFSYREGGSCDGGNSGVLPFSTLTDHFMSF